MKWNILSDDMVFKEYWYCNYRCHKKMISWLGEYLSFDCFWSILPELNAQCQDIIWFHHFDVMFLNEINRIEIDFFFFKNQAMRIMVCLICRSMNIVVGESSFYQEKLKQILENIFKHSTSSIGMHKWYLFGTLFCPVSIKRLLHSHPFDFKRFREFHIATHLRTLPLFWVWINDGLLSHLTTQYRSNYNIQKSTFWVLPFQIATFEYDTLPHFVSAACFVYERISVVAMETGVRTFSRNRFRNSSPDIMRLSEYKNCNQRGNPK